MATWRKGLRWDKTEGGWVVVKTRRKLTPIGLKRRKSKPPKPKKPKPKPRKPKPKKPKPRKPKKPLTKPKPKRLKGWRKGLRWDKSVKRWREVSSKRMLTDRAIDFRRDFLIMEKSVKEAGDKREEIFEIIKQTLKNAMNSLIAEGFAADMGRPHKNKDGSIDAVLRIKPSRTQSVNEIFLAMEEHLSPIPDAFVSTAVRYHPRKDEEFYTKFKGMSQAQAYYQDMSPEKLHFNFISGRQIDIEMLKRGRRKAEQVVVLVNWNPEYERPQTPWQREIQKARKKKGSK